MIPTAKGIRWNYSRGQQPGVSCCESSKEGRKEVRKEGRKEEGMSLNFIQA
jgi:hypothetical protein